MRILGYVSDELYVALPEVLAEFQSLDNGAVTVLHSSPRGAFYGELPDGAYRVTLAKQGFGSKIVTFKLGAKPYAVPPPRPWTDCSGICGRNGYGPANVPKCVCIPWSNIN